MRVLHILNELKPSGAEVMLYTAAPYWRAQGIEGHILSTGARPGGFASVLEEAGYRIHHIPFSDSYSFLTRIYALLTDNKYDALHIHTERANFWYALAGYLSGHKRIVRTVHNVFLFKGKLRIERLVQRWLVHRILGVKCVSISPSVEEIELRTFHNFSQRVSNWFDSRKFKLPSLQEKKDARKSLAIPDGTVVLTSVGGCSPVKNHSVIIEALAMLPVDAAILYLHVGPEEDGHPERKLAQAAGASSRVRFYGTVQDITSILHASDVFVMPSLYEGCPIATIEAMGAGLPCILSDVPGLCDFREAGDGIYWVKPTAESIQKGLLHFLEMPMSTRHHAGTVLSRYAHHCFSVDRGAAAYSQLYMGQAAAPGCEHFDRLT
jgi:glycosyltransferase involved in cell wall biosynthesis